MEIEIRHLKRRGQGTVSTQNERHSVRRLSIGRASRHELHLPDPRLLLDHAHIREKEGAAWFFTDAPEITQVDGKTTAEIALVPGVVISLGPYELTVLPPEPGLDLIFSLELVVPLDDASDIMRRAHEQSMDRSSRVLAWLSIIAFVGVLGVVFVWPLSSELGPKLQGQGAGTWERAHPLDRPPRDIRHFWTVGALSQAHGFMEQQCEACHAKPFSRVPKESCATCHAETAHHVDPDDAPMAEIQDAACGACHREHDPKGEIVVKSQEFCTDCHATDKIKQAGFDLEKVTDFGLGHPQFKPRIVTDAKNLVFKRVPLATVGAVTEDTMFRFPHHVHLAKQSNTQLGPEAERALSCIDCHVPNQDGPRMRPLRMETHCRECHKLRFQAGQVSRELPHGQPLAVQLMVTDIIRKSEIEQTRLRLKYSTKPPDTQNLLSDLEARVVKKTADSLSVVFSNLCGTCHTVRPGADDDPQKFHIAPVILPNHWLTKARFDHRGHETIACTQCHQAKTSTKATDVLIPPRDTCRGCHGGENTIDKVRSTCVMCHGFHHEGNPAMAEK